jgi:hypothetical protein
VEIPVTVALTEGSTSSDRRSKIHRIVDSYKRLSTMWPMVGDVSRQGMFAFGCGSCRASPVRVIGVLVGGELLSEGIIAGGPNGCAKTRAARPLR